MYPKNLQCINLLNQDLPSVAGRSGSCCTLEEDLPCSITLTSENSLGVKHSWILSALLRALISMRRSPSHLYVLGSHVRMCKYWEPVDFADLLERVVPKLRLEPPVKFCCCFLCLLICFMMNSRSFELTDLKLISTMRS